MELDVGAYIAKTDIFNKLRVNVGFGDEGFEGLVDDEVEGRVFEATFAAFCEGCADGTGDDYVIGILLGAAVEVSTVQGAKQRSNGGSYMVESPDLAGLRWLRMELSLSVAMIATCESGSIMNKDTKGSLV